MSISELIVNGSSITLIIITLIQIAPIKINPWSFIVEKARKIIYGPVEEKLDKLEHKLDEREASNSRYRILRFSDEVLQGTRHTQEHFDQVLDDIKVYEDFCRSHPDYPNNKAVLAIETIKDVYRNCMQNHDFL